MQTVLKPVHQKEGQELTALLSAPHVQVETGQSTICVVFPHLKSLLSQSLLGLGETSGIISRLFQLLDYIFPYLKLTLFLKQHLI